MPKRGMLNYGTAFVLTAEEKLKRMLKMVKINCCDICHKEGKLKRAKRYMKVKGQRSLRIDFCPECEKKLPKNNIEYVKFCYRLQDIELSDNEAKKMLKGD